VRSVREALSWARHHKVIAAVAVIAVLAVIGALAPSNDKQDSSRAAGATTASPQPSAPPTQAATTVASPIAAATDVAGGGTSAPAPPPTTAAATVTKPTPPPATASAPAPSAALRALASLAVKGRAPKTGYDRALFGPAWADVDHNGCDTRNDILRRDLVQIIYKASDPGCTVATGVLHDPYTGKTIQFTRGVGTSTAVQIDHLVALSDAWQKGAQQWGAAKREQFANDPLELLAVDGPTNEAKGDGDAATWLPPNKAYRCTYVSKQVAVKAKYGLWVTQAEHDAVARILASCGAATVPAAPTTPPPVAATTAPPTAPPARDVVYYANCAAVRAAGKAPLHRGDPGYRSGLDRDGDGVACE
jgi:hypothetical protein